MSLPVREAATVPCETCSTPTRMTGTKRCNNCWEVESRMEIYLRSENGRKFLRALLPELCPHGNELKLDEDGPCGCRQVEA